MQLIYTWAERVVIWLGVKLDVLHPSGDAFNIICDMREAWRHGEGKMLATALNLPICETEPDETQFDKEANSQIRYSVAPETSDQESILANYWKRMWIIQEVCLGKTPPFLYGPKLWTFEQVVSVLANETQISKLSPSIGYEGIAEVTKDVPFRRLLAPKTKLTAQHPWQ